MSALVEARGVTLRYHPGKPAAVAGVELEVGQAAAVGIVGESGSGKSTLARLLSGVLPPSSGDVLVAGRRWQDVGSRDPLRRTVQMIFQDPYGALNPLMTAKQAVAEVFRHWDRIPHREAIERAEELLAETGLSRDAMGRRRRELSGGQCQRVGIARALACGPDLLIADEPTSALDVSVQGQILNTLIRLREERGLALILISHDLGVVRYMTDSALVMYAGRVVERGGTRDLLTAPAHPYTRVLVDSIAGGQSGVRATINSVPDAHPCRFARRCPCLQADCVNLTAVPTERKDPRSVECVHPLVDQGSSKLPAESGRSLS